MNPKENGQIADGTNPTGLSLADGIDISIEATLIRKGGDKAAREFNIYKTRFDLFAADARRISIAAHEDGREFRDVPLVLAELEHASRKKELARLMERYIDSQEQIRIACNRRFPPAKGVTDGQPTSIGGFLARDVNETFVGFFIGMVDDSVLKASGNFPKYAEASAEFTAYHLLNEFQKQKASFSYFGNEGFSQGVWDDVEVSPDTKKRLGNIYTFISQKLDEHHARVTDTLFGNPESEEYQQIKPAVEKLLAIEGSHGYVASNLGVNPDNFHLYFRECKNMEREHPEEAPLFMRLRDRIVDMFKDYGRYHILTAEDIDEFAPNAESAEAIEAGGIETKQIVSEIFSNSGSTEYTVAPDDVEWEFLTPPGQISLRFFNNGNTYKIEYRWFDGDDQIAGVASIVDTKQNTHDWSILESPHDPDAEYLSWAFIAEDKKVLQDVLRQAKEIKIKRQTQKNKKGETKPQARKEKRERFQDPIYRMRKTATQSRTVEENLHTFEAISQIEMAIVDADETLIEKMPTLTPEVQQVVLQAVHRFNEIGGSRLSRKHQRGKDGKPRYTLSVRTPAGDVRVLVHEVESTKGNRSFEVVDIDHRKDIYRKPSYRN